MDNRTMIELISRIISTAKIDYNIIETYTNQIKDQASPHLSWNLAHLNIAMLDYIRDLERHQKYLYEHGTPAGRWPESE